MHWGELNLIDCHIVCKKILTMLRLLSKFLTWNDIVKYVSNKISMLPNWFWSESTIQWTLKKILCFLTRFYASCHDFNKTLQLQVNFKRFLLFKLYSFARSYLYTELRRRNRRYNRNEHAGDAYITLLGLVLSRNSLTSAWGRSACCWRSGRTGCCHACGRPTSSRSCSSVSSRCRWAWMAANRRGV